MEFIGWTQQERIKRGCWQYQDRRLLFEDLVREKIGNLELELMKDYQLTFRQLKIYMDDHSRRMYTEIFRQ